MCLFRSQTIHSVLPTEAGTNYYVLKVDPALLLSLASPKNGTTYSLMLSLALSNNDSKIRWTAKECKRHELPTLFERMAKEMSSSQYGADIACKICIGEILLRVLQDLKEQMHASSIFDYENNSFVRKLYDIIEYVNQHYTENITAEECSKKLFVSYSYFSRKFKQITGKNFKNYLISIRINHAEKLLLSTSESITNIATKCGFNSISYFSSMYKEFKGIAPSQVRSRHI